MIVFTPTGFAFIGITLFGSLFACQAAAADLTVIVDPMKGKGGHVRAAVFDDPKTFPKTVLRGQKIDAGDAAVTLTFKDLPKGRYAVSAYQDLNLNDKLDTNAFGMPKEPYGFSRNARGRFGPPAFDDASIDLGAENKTIRIRVE